jgi:DMSO/TMAO reductase YedYZ molybdopterin-dependent catalytic subunit
MKHLNFIRLFTIAVVLIGFLGCQDATKKTVDLSTNSPSNNGLVKVPNKVDLILLTDRPFNLETPLHYFLQDLTPNNAFFVRWHMSNLPGVINTDTFHLRIKGAVKNQLAITMESLKSDFKPVELTAVCACAGNARSCFNPRVAGAQWVNGGMGNAHWKGVRLKDVLEKAGVNSQAKFVSFNGMDNPPLAGTPDFVKSLTLAHALDGEIIIAYEMNGEPIPMLNGYPLKLVVPGWYATYWVGMLNEITVLTDTFQGFWMKKAYLVPKNVYNGNEQLDSLAKNLVPINKIAVRSIFVAPEPEESILIGKEITIQGLAFDEGAGIQKVEISLDNGKSWSTCKLDPSLGNYSWQRWRFQYTPSASGKIVFMAKATNNNGATQPLHHWNRSGYMRNEIETLTLMAH